MKVGDWTIEPVKDPTPTDVTLVGFPPTVYILNFTNSAGRTSRETIVLYEPPTTEAIENAVAQIAQRLDLIIEREENNWGVSE